jgi:hypothetical protein
VKEFAWKTAKSFVFKDTIVAAVAVRSRHTSKKGQPVG